MLHFFGSYFASPWTCSSCWVSARPRPPHGFIKTPTWIGSVESPTLKKHQTQPQQHPCLCPSTCTTQLHKNLLSAIVCIKPLPLFHTPFPTFLIGSDLIAPQVNVLIGRRACIECNVWNRIAIICLFRDCRGHFSIPVNPFRPRSTIIHRNLTHYVEINL